MCLLPSLFSVVSALSVKEEGEEEIGSELQVEMSVGESGASAPIHSQRGRNGASSGSSSTTGSIDVASELDTGLELVTWLLSEAKKGFLQV